MISNSPESFPKVTICIIGSGIGGGTLAKELSLKGKSFCIVEAGSWKGNSKHVNYENIGLDFGVRSTTTIQIGGTSNLWHGVLAPLDEIDFKLRNWIPHSGWPISLDDLRSFYDRAANILQVEKCAFFQEGKLPQQLKAQLSDLPFNRELLVNKLFQQPVPQVNFKDVVREVCEDSENHHLFYNTTALELVRKEGKITRLKVGLPDGKISYINADLFIVCSGALETPRLLLNSNLSNANIGKYLMDHPMGNLCQLEFLQPKKYPIYSDFKLAKNMKIKTGLELTENEQKKLCLPNNNFYLRPSFIKGIDDESEKLKLSLLAFKDGKVSFSDGWKLLTNLNVIRQILTYKLSLDVTFKYADLFFVTEQVPNEQSYVSRSEIKDAWGYPISRVNWQICQQDIDSMKTWFELLLTELFPKSYFRFTHTLQDFKWETIFTSAIHHVGTARMGYSKIEGVVDRNLCVFGEDNLFVCDGSVFTTAGNVNNGFTISALACRLAKYLTEES